MNCVKVLIVEDSIFFREILLRELRKEPGIEVAGIAADPFEARDKLLELRPDVMVLDVGLPRMDGIEFLRRLLPQYSIPVVVSSAHAGVEAGAMAAGAAAFVAKPDSSRGMEDYAKELALSIRTASKPRERRKFRAPGAAWEDEDALEKAAFSLKIRASVIAIGASTGGTEAIYSVLARLPEQLPGIVMVQHMPPGFTGMYAERLDRDCAFHVKEAADGDRVEPGLALLAPAGDRHMKLMRDTRGYYVALHWMDKVSGHRPSVDVLFDSVADAAGDKALGVLLTGMGADGAKGLLKMRSRGAYTIGQDKETSVVYGMPMVANSIGAVARQLPLSAISKEIVDRLGRA
ncbi:MAG: chemotaxis-specific protein-glutamate methyltransferase CheB [Clostridiales Family XIII bacterium]|jgi:two-component system chemotaxis response regulator CheB|nr:chemotaxis-specific protein-glutamate methyltransferase CheB [Clostridiales Family XIII bacterium]